MVMGMLVLTVLERWEGWTERDGGLVRIVVGGLMTPISAALKGQQVFCILQMERRYDEHTAIDRKL